MKSLFFFCLMVTSAVLVCDGQTPNKSAACPEETKRADRAEARLKDWPQLARYHDADNKVLPPGKNEERVVFLGDSITDGWKLDQYFPGKGYINRGISGQTTPQMLIRFRPDVIDLKPRVVVILAGTNDLAGNTGPTTIEAIEANLASIADLARANRTYVVLATVLPVSDYNKDRNGKPIVRSGDRPPEKILALNAWMKKYAADNGLGYLDYFSAMVDEHGFLKPDLSYDGLHPNEKGYEIMKSLAEQAIAQALKHKVKR